jgi:hypothetical protein
MSAGDVNDITSDGGIVAWFMSDLTSQDRNIFSKWANVGGNDGYVMCMTGANTFLAGFNGAAFPNGGAITTGVWHHGAGRPYSGGCAAIYDGTEVAGSTGTTMNNTGASFLIGGAAGAGARWDGKVAMVATWNSVIANAEHIAMSKGVSPLLVRPGSALTSFLPLWGCADPEADLSGNKFNMTGTGSPTVPTAHPPMGPYCLSGVGV